jgi:hypothetical protein
MPDPRQVPVPARSARTSPAAVGLAISCYAVVTFAFCRPFVAADQAVPLACGVGLLTLTSWAVITSASGFLGSMANMYDPRFSDPHVEQDDRTASKNDLVDEFSAGNSLVIGFVLAAASILGILWLTASLFRLLRF